MKIVMPRHSSAGSYDVLCLVMLAAVLHWNPVLSFSPVLSTRHGHRTGGSFDVSIRGSNDSGNDDGPAPTAPPVSIDVSDLGLTVEDLEKPIPSELLGDFKITASGIQSTSRVESINDEGCLWEESADLIGATLSIEGLRGQPVAAMDVAFSTTTCTVTVFGYAVWSCVLRGECRPESALTKVEDGYDMTPLITLSVAKKKDENGAPAPRWGGFIGTIGEDSIL